MPVTWNPNREVSSKKVQMRALPMIASPLPICSFGSHMRGGMDVAVGRGSHVGGDRDREAKMHTRSTSRVTYLCCFATMGT